MYCVQVEVGGEVGDYIVTQGPLPDTVGAFWQLVLEQDVTVVVMLTGETEGGKVKCHRYWPDSVHTPLDVCDGYVLHVRVDR